MTTSQFKVSINSLWPGDKLRTQGEGETRWGRHTGAWRTETHTLESLCRRVTGDGYSFCAVLKQPWRKAENFESVQVLATDNDGASLATLAEIPLVEDHSAFIYESPSSTPEQPKARVVFVLDEPITDPQICRLAYRALIWHFSNGAPDQAADEACKDCCRFFYGRPKAPHAFLGNILYKDVLQELIERYLRSGTGSDLSTPAAYTRTGAYDPHRGPQLAGADQGALAKFLFPFGLKVGHDGRFNGPCIFHDCDCPGALYVSGKTGSWFCFCSDHPGVNHGSVGDLEALGFTPAHAREVSPDREGVGFIYKRPCIDKTDTWVPPKRDNTKRSTLWDFARAAFPYPTGSQPKLRSCILHSAERGETLVVDLVVDTWFVAANAAFKKSKYYYHGVRKLSMFENRYFKDVPVDDWSEEYHEALQKAIGRVDGQYLAIDNQLSRGCWRYLSTVPIRDFAPLDDLSCWLLDSLRGIRVPEHHEKGQRFRPVRGSHALTKGCQAPVDEDAGKFEMVAEKKEATDWAAMEANLREAGAQYEYLDPVYRAQHRQGIRFSGLNLDQVRDLAVYLGYPLHGKGRKKSEATGVSNGQT
jgi:hypothetical protein